MKRTRSTKNAKAKARVLDLCVKSDRTIRQASAILKAEGFERGVSRTRVGVALQEIAQDMSDKVPQERQKAYNRLSRFLDELEEAKREGKLNLRASIADSLQVMDRLSKLLGLDAPTKAINANFAPVAAGIVAMDFSEPVQKTPDLISEEQYQEEAERTTAIVKAGIEE